MFCQALGKSPHSSEKIYGSDFKTQSLRSGKRKVCRWTAGSHDLGVAWPLYNGEGTREGTGECRCDSGYKGDMCLECKDGFYEESSNETHTICKVCHISCKNICTEGGPKGCDECKKGWQEDEELGCQDIDECATAPCEENQYCSNTQGSYTCFTCDVACDSCTGAGPKKCKECSTGFTFNEDSTECLDDNECSADPSLCSGENEMCKNTPGTYECVCQTGFVRRDNVCVTAPKDAESETGFVEDEDIKKDESEESAKEEL
ncbi:cysteine-rich with egf-like domain protein 2 [Plakobranchus ocellatus]|uniref:protein disulfide-isomerase n=1 Tax=Plakobranchus ocellatus TaxID=259542 RepID=A0AAV4DJL3_9GAST|nr:cysteine-rich with egf-like domain protein 2 [Plakobranchus ocellatus]